AGPWGPRDGDDRVAEGGSHFFYPGEAAMDVRKVGILVVGALGLGAVGWALWGPAGPPDFASRAEAVQQGQGKGKGGNKGRYQFVSSQAAIVMIDTQTDKTYALVGGLFAPD